MDSYQLSKSDESDIISDEESVSKEEEEGLSGVSDTSLLSSSLDTRPADKGHMNIDEFTSDDEEDQQ